MRNVKALMTSGRDDWETPDDLFDELNKEFNFFVDICASDDNKKCDHFIDKETDSLSIPSWGSCPGPIWCNPPYGRDIGLWVERCYQESQRGNTVVLLIPARTDTKWFHEFVYNKAEIRFIKGRLTFKGAKHNAPFPSMIVVFRPPISSLDRGKG